ncbi:MAG TPA: hypothetical protein VNQ90_09140 [Chthoniobacteraceae bacterium]|nr:hypothetical protein [Chthoniobacteraceae bacterium]
MKQRFPALLAVCLFWNAVAVQADIQVIHQNRTYSKDGWYDSAAYQRLSLLSPRYQLIISESNPHRRKDDASWSLFRFLYRNRPLLSDTGANGTLLRVRHSEGGDGSSWIGSYYGGSPVGKLALRIGKKEHPLSPAAEIRTDTDWSRHELGKEKVVEFSKTARLGPYRYDASLRLDESGLTETLTFTPLESAPRVVGFLPYNHNLDAGYTDWIAQTRDGLQEGRFISGLKEDGPGESLEGCRWIAAYCPKSKTGILIAYLSPAPDGGRDLLRSRPADHVHQLSLPPPEKEPLTLVCRIAGFDAGEANWKAEAQRLADTLSP